MSLRALLVGAAWPSPARFSSLWVEAGSAQLEKACLDVEITNVSAPAGSPRARRAAA